MDTLPPTEIHQTEDFKKCPNLIQHAESDYSNAIRIERGVSLDEAIFIARSDNDIDYFFYVKTDELTQEIPPEAHYDPNQDPLELGTYVDFRGDKEGMHCGGFCRSFRYGDAVFFKNEGKWLDKADGLADIYEKNNRD